MNFWNKKTFKVKLRGRSKVEYIEGGRHISIDSEFMSDEEPGIILYAGNLTCWDRPFEREILSQDDLDRIKKNVLVDLKKYDIIAEWH